MAERRIVNFGPFRLDLADERLWQGQEIVRLTHKAFALLRCLVERAGQLVTKDALLEAVWPDTVISEATLTGCLREVRRALKDSARHPQFIETAHGRGYRFIAPVTLAEASATPRELTGSHHPTRAAHPRSDLLVSRDTELAQLHQCYTTACQGTRQIAFITGEAGIGKTALVEAFVAQILTEDPPWIGYGQCIEHYGAGEAYLPVLEALGRLGRGPDGASLVACLQQYAPSWLSQLLSLLPMAEHEAFRHTAYRATQTRMLREIAEALEMLTAERPLVLVLEDLHWCDGSTLEWLAYIARRRDPARLVILGTYRPVEAIVQGHPLRRVTQELQQHGQCTELALDYLPETGVTAYLLQRFGGQALPTGLASALHQRTSGNPLFLIAVVDDLVRQGVFSEAEGRWVLQGELASVTTGVPASLRHLIEHQLDQVLPEDQMLLEAASVAGATFPVAAVAAMTGQTEDTVEARWSTWSRRGHFVRAEGTEAWPDGTVTARYRFIHALYHEAVYQRVSPGHLVRLHQRMAAYLEASYDEQVSEIAAQLAMHYARGQNPLRAVPYYQQAAQNALSRSGYQEAMAQVQEGLALLPSLPNTSERMQLELALQITLGQTLMVTEGMAGQNLEPVFVRARHLCQEVGDTPQLFQVLSGLRRLYFGRAELQRARELGEQLLTVAQNVRDPRYLMGAHSYQGSTLYCLGDLVAARAYLEQSLLFFDRQQHDSQAFLHGINPVATCLSWTSLVLWELGYPDQALQRSGDALALARELEHPYTLGAARGFVPVLHQYRQEVEATREQAATAVTYATEQGFPYWLARARILHGWALAKQGQGARGIAEVRQGIIDWQATGAVLNMPYYLFLLADAYGQDGQPCEGLRVIAEALAVVHATEEQVFEAELYRLKGDLLLMQAMDNHGEAAICFHHALATARRQQAKSLEIRAATRLSRLWQQQRKRDEARALLAAIYGWFTEGLATADLQEAKGLLEELE